jgi:hypothetical protein
METDRKKIDLELVKNLMEESYYLIYVDYNDNLNGHPRVFRECIEGKSADKLFALFDNMYLDSEDDAIRQSLDKIKERLREAGYTQCEIDNFFREHEGEVREGIWERDDSDTVEKLLRNTSNIPVRVEMYSNYDCINSHWFESQGGFSYEKSYFGDMLDALNLNPRKVKRLLVEHGEKVCGRFSDRRSRNGKEHVSYEHFYKEHINSCCGANLLTFMATVNPVKLYESGFNLSKLTIPKGNKCGLFSSTYGGGSILEMELLHDVTIDLKRKEYPRYGLEIEANGKDYNYSIHQTYGLDRSAYGKPVTIAAVQQEQRISA